MQAYLDNKREGAVGSQLVMLFMFAVGIISIITAEQILTGWLPLGERANILRSNLNWIEWTSIIASTLFGIASLRTAWGLYSREEASGSWAKWMTLIAFFIGLALTASFVIPTVIKYFLLLSEVSGGTPSGDDATLQTLGFYALFAGFILLILPTKQLKLTALQGQINRFGGIIFGVGFVALIVGMYSWVNQFPSDVPNIRPPDSLRLLPGLLLMVPGLLSYRFATKDGEQSDELRRAVAMSPSKFIRVQLAKSPSAGAIIGFITIFLGFTMATDLFLAPTSIASVLTNISSKGVIAIGITMLMISGEFDLSVGSILGVVAMAFMTFMTEGIPGLDTGPIDVFPAAIMALGIAVILGAINGFILVRTGIPSFIVTLGTLLAYRAITLVVIAGGRILRYRDYFDEFPILYIAPWVMILLAAAALALVTFFAYRTLPGLWSRFMSNWANQNDNGHFGTTTALWSGVVATFVTGITAIFAIWLIFVMLYHLEQGQTVAVGWFDLINGRWSFTLSEVTRGLVSIEIPRDANFRMAIVWWLIFVFIFNVILMNTRYGNAVFAVGGNVGAARAQGINVDRIKVQNFILCALLTGVAAIYETARNPGVDPLKGNTWELEVIAMTVIGGALLNGGYGSIFGAFLGALIFGMLQTGLVLVGIDSRLFSGTVGVIIIVAVVLNTTVRGRST